MAELEYAVLDHHRAGRTGVPEVVFGQGKTPEQIVTIMARIVEREGRVMATRLPDEAITAIGERFPDAACYSLARVAILDRRPEAERDAAAASAADETQPYVAVVTAGTGDLPVAEEAALTLTFLGARVVRVNDVGVAGLHRLLSRRKILKEAHVVIAVAGMEGALPSVIGGLVACPVVAVPTSIGYGASFGGLAALLAMLNSCAPGVAVVNIDNGFGAAVHAYKILRSATR
ncbi:MAG: nickel pincer cofactor biosynthesis protein LarB [Anaerolineae bacterium]